MPRPGKHAISVLVVEDDPEVQAYLRCSIGSLVLVEDRDTDVRVAGDLATAAKELRDEPADLVVLDLDLPDSSGVDTVVEIAVLTRSAIVVVTGAADVGQVQRIVLAGAHDCLVKGEFDGRELARTLRVNIARHRRVREVVSDLATQRDVLAEALDRAGLGTDRAESEEPTGGAVPTTFVSGRESGLSSTTMGVISLAESFPDQVPEFVAAYAELAMHRLEERGLHVDYQVATRSRKLAWDLGRLRARPRDLVEIHLAGVADLTPGKTAARRAAISRASESLLIETMGHLTTYYRTQLLGSTAVAPPPQEARDRAMPA